MSELPDELNVQSVSLLAHLARFLPVFRKLPINYEVGSKKKKVVYSKPNGGYNFH